MSADRPLTFGKYRGFTLAELVGADRGYVEWLAHAGDEPFWRAAAHAALNPDDPPEDDAEPAAALAATVMPLIVFEFWQAMEARHRDDPAAAPVIRAAVEELKRLCSRYTNRPWIECPQ